MMKHKIRFYAGLLAVIMTGNVGLTLCKMHFRSSENIKLVAQQMEDSDYPYFHRAPNKIATVDDIVLSLDEKTGTDLTTAKDWAQKIKATGYVSDDIINTLNIDDYLFDALTDPNVTGLVMKHDNMLFYNRSKDTINWTNLALKIKANGTLLVLFDSLNLVKKENHDKYKGIKNMSLDDINIVLNQLKEIVLETKKRYLDYDMAHLACLLSHIAFTYRDNADSETLGVVAATSFEDISWILTSDSKYPSLESFKPINMHEFKHFLAAACPDEYQADVYTTFTGINYYEDDTLMFNFIEEVTAEEYAMSLTDRGLLASFEEREILDNIRFVLSLQDDYEQDGFLRYSLSKNPIALLEQFPVFSNEDFVDVVKMLVAYDLMLGLFPSDLYEKALEINPDLDIQSFINIVVDYANIQLTDLFFINLLVLNETKDVPIDYNMYLIRLFEQRMSVGFFALLQTRGYHITIDNYNALYSQKLDVFLTYLAEKYDLAPYKTYSEYQLPKEYDYPAFVSKDVIELYDNIRDRRYNLEAIREVVNDELAKYLVYK